MKIALGICVSVAFAACSPQQISEDTHPKQVIPKDAHVERVAPSAEVQGGVDARLLRYPDISEHHIVFAYAGDIWVAPREGGDAHRLTSAPGQELFPRFSPDGAMVAFSANYGGNQDIYVIPVTGGMPKRLTWHPSEDRVVDWLPDGRSILFASMRENGIEDITQLYTIPVVGGAATKLSVPYGEFGMIAPDGATLAYVPMAMDFATWKRYRGGQMSSIWLLDLRTHTSRALLVGGANNSQPMWHGNSLYFLSDRDVNKRSNIWHCDVATETLTQLTQFETMDVAFPAIGNGRIIFECGGMLHILDLANSKCEPVNIRVITDHATLVPRTENVSKLVRNVDLSPSAKRFVVEARGELFSVPREHGAVINLTQTSGVAERNPSLSPDGKTLAYFTDRTGEYELALRSFDESDEERILTKLGPGFRYRPQWSPDGTKVVFVDHNMQIFLCQVSSGELVKVDRCLSKFHSELKMFEPSWSPDSRWFAYSTEASVDSKTTFNEAIFVYDTEERVLRQVTSAHFEDSSPVFDPGGKYLYYISKRKFDAPLYSDIEATWIYADMRMIVAVPLRRDTPSAVATRNDVDLGVESESADQSGGKHESDSQSAAAGGATAGDSIPLKRRPPDPVSIDFEGFEKRAAVLSLKSGNYSQLKAVSGKLLYIARAEAPAWGIDKSQSVLVMYDLEKREEKTVLEDAQSFKIAGDSKQALARVGDNFVLFAIGENAKAEHTYDFKNLESTVDPRLEWRQLFTETWRFQRDYFYDPGMHGVDWLEMKRRYEPLIDACMTRWDVNYVIGEMLGELCAGHVFRWGGDTDDAAPRKTGLLGCDFEIAEGHYRIKHIVVGAPWDVDARSPLADPSLNVKVGDYLLAVNGAPLDVTKEPWAALDGLAGMAVILTVNDKPLLEGARRIPVTPMTDERTLRYRQGVESNRRKVELATGGRVGYVHVPDTGISGQGELVRQFQGQFTKDAMVIDERFNTGGQSPVRFIEYLNRPLLSYWGTRSGRIFKTPEPRGGDIPMAMLINGWAGSGGDAFPYYFRMNGLGPAIGTTTWGGLIGYIELELYDGGTVTAPTFGIFSKEGEWIIENEGVKPDIEVLDDPAKRIHGGDPQLERAIEYLLAELEKNPPKLPTRPVYPDKSGR